MRLDDRVNITAPKAHARRIQHAIRAAKEEDLASRGVDLDEVSMRPDMWEARVVRIVVSLAGLVAPEEDRLVRKAGCRDEFARFSCGYRAPRAGFNQAIVHLELGA